MQRRSGTAPHARLRSSTPAAATAAEDMTAENKVGAADTKPDIANDEEIPSTKETGVAACCGPETSILGVTVRLLACSVAGLVFGLALEKGRVFEPQAIRNQMVFSQWTMMKMFLAAMGTGQLLLAILSIIPPLRPFFSFACINFTYTLDDKGILTSTLGPFLLGVGMTVSGACPGMVFAQVGSVTTNGAFTLAGCFLGALLFGIVGPYIRKITMPAKPYTFQTIQQKTGIFFVYMALPMSIIILGLAVMLEILIPWHSDLPVESQNPINGTSTVFSMKAWPPSISGAMIGLMQVVVTIAVKDTLGSSSSYMTIASQWLITEKLQNTFSFLAKHRCGLGNWWQVFYVLFAMGGAFLSSFLSNSVGTTKGVDIPSAVVGGFLLVVGSRIAAGCTSGHGLSGTALLFWLSLLAVPAMFAGAIGAAFAMKGFNVLDTYVCPSGRACGA